jgi:D-sedoheptulose 7-phosphate isomerase
MGCEVIGLTGRDGGALKGHCRALVIAASHDTAHIQEAHIVVIHLLCALIEKQLDWAA